jgi:hypothetical protein
LGYCFCWSPFAQVDNALIAKVCQASMKVTPIYGPIDAQKLIDRVANIVLDMLGLKWIIAHALGQCFGHFREFQAMVSRLEADPVFIFIQ